MAEVELRRMNRTELIEIIYALQQEEKKLRTECEGLRQQVEDKRLRLEQSGSIAEAALNVNHIFEDAEKAAQQYLNELQIRSQQAELVVEEAHHQAEQMITVANQEAEQIKIQCEDMRREAEQLLAKANREAEQIKKECEELRSKTEQQIKQDRTALAEEAKNLYQKYVDLAGGAVEGAM